MAEQTGQKIRVLLVDDHAIMREGIRMILSQDPDIEVVGEAGDGHEAIELVGQLHPDIALMDINMPKLGGIEATKVIRERNPDVRVLILSMYESEEYILPILKVGASGYVLKRTAAKELVAALKGVMQGQVILHPDVAKAVLGSLQGGSSGHGAAAHSPDWRRSHPDLEHITEREREVLVLVARGLTNQQIAERLYISVKTVQAHRANLMEKLDLHDAVELTKFAIRTGLVSIDDV